MDQQMKQDAQVLMEVVRRGKVEDQERVRLSTLAFLFWMRAALGRKEAPPSEKSEPITAA